MMKNETKSTKCRQCRCTIFPSDGEQLKDMGFCSWMCVQDWDRGCDYLEFNGEHR